jgi:hypothetical protein
MPAESPATQTIEPLLDGDHSPFAIAWAKGKQAAWENRYLGLCLWLFGTAVVVGYYRFDPIHEMLESLGDLKTRSGWIFAVISTAVFGGLLPVVLPRLFGTFKKRVRSQQKLRVAGVEQSAAPGRATRIAALDPSHPEKHLSDLQLDPDRKPTSPATEKAASFWSLLISNVIFWGYKGWEIDTFYRFQSWLFGNLTDFSTIAAKTIFDMVVFAPAIGLFNCVLFYIWRDHGYSFSRMRHSLGKNWYAKKVLPALISNACVWTPAVILIYSLPPALQLPVQNLILCAWVLVLVFFTQAEPSATVDESK